MIFFHSLLLLGFVCYASKRSAPSGVENERPLKKACVEEEEQRLVLGSELPLDIWHAIFSQADGATLHPLSATCQRFRHLIFDSDPSLKDALKSPSGILEGLVTGRPMISDEDSIYVEASLHAAFYPDVDIVRLARLLARCRSEKISKYIMDELAEALSSKGQDEIEGISTALAGRLLVEYASFHDLQDFPTTVETFENSVATTDDGFWRRYSRAGLICPYLRLTRSAALTKYILENLLLSQWTIIRAGLHLRGNLPSTSDFFTVLHADLTGKLVQQISPLSGSLHQQTVETFCKKLMVVACVFHGVINNELHNQFRSLVAFVLNWKQPLIDLSFRMNLNKARSLIGKGEFSLKEIFGFALKWKIPTDPMLQSLSKWLELRACTNGLRQKVGAFGDYLHQIEQLESLPRLFANDHELSTDFIIAFANKKLLREKLYGILELSEAEFELYLPVLAVAYDFDPGRLIPRLDEFQDNSRVLPDYDDFFLLSFDKTSSKFLKTFRVFEACGKEHVLLKAISADIKLAWLADQEHIEAFHSMMQELTEEILAAISRYVCKLWYLRPALKLSGALTDFQAAFPYLPNLDISEDKLQACLKHKHGLKRMKATLKLLQLDSEKFHANLSSP